LGPYFFEDNKGHAVTVNTECYVAMLNEFILPELVEGMNAYMHKYVYNYTYICNCDSLIICNFGSSLYFVKKIDCYTSLVAHPITRFMFHSLIFLFFLLLHLPT
jgi:hypothetical protein